MISHALNYLIFLFVFNLIMQTHLEKTKLDLFSSITSLNVLFSSNKIISLYIVLIYYLLYLGLLIASLYVQRILMLAISSAENANRNAKVIKANSSLVKLTYTSIVQIIFASLSSLIILSSSLLYLAFLALVKYYRANYKGVGLDTSIIS